MMRFGHGNPIFSSVPEHPPVETPMAKGATAMPAKKPTELTDWNPIVRIARLQIIESLSAAQIFTTIVSIVRQPAAKASHLHH
jgi:hypothetical protein